MQLLFLYGPLAVGKTTVARELTSLTGFKLFDNDTGNRAVTTVFPFGSAPHFRIVNALRRMVFEEAAEAGVDLIFTYVYAHPQDDASVHDIISSIENRSGEVLMIRLHANLDILRRRFITDERRWEGKLASEEQLDGLLAEYDLLSPFPDRPGLALDTGALAPGEVARRIVEHYRLRTADEGSNHA